MRIAIVGSGIAGLTAARELARARHEVVVFESREWPAMLAHTARFRLDGKRHTIDSLLAWDTYHGEFCDLLRELGLSLRDFPMHSVSFSAEGGVAPYARYRSRRLWPLHHNVLVPSARSATETWRIMMFWLRGWLRARRNRRQEPGASVEDFFAGDSATDYRRLIYPWLDGCFGFVCADVLRRTPASSMLAFQLATLAHSPQVVAEGMPELARRLQAGSELRFGHEVKRVVPGAEGGAFTGVRVHAVSGGRSVSETFDSLVFAVSPQTVGRLVEGLDDAERAIWSAFDECPVRLHVHTDQRLMPFDPRDWSSVNYRLRDDPAGSIELTIWSNDVVDVDTPTQIFFTWNPIVPPAVDKLLYRADLIRVVPTVEVQPLLDDQIPRLQGKRNLWYCGTWAVAHRGSYLEEGVQSARRVASRLLAEQLRARSRDARRGSGPVVVDRQSAVS